MMMFDSVEETWQENVNVSNYRTGSNKKIRNYLKGLKSQLSNMMYIFPQRALYNMGLSKPVVCSHTPSKVSDVKKG